MSGVPEWALRARAKWRHRGAERPPLAEQPGPDQESVWDFPRPPRVAEDGRRVVVGVGDVIIADTRESLRVLETASAPTFYIPPDDVETMLLRSEHGESWCEWKGRATYRSLVLPNQIIERVAWGYDNPWPGYEAIRDHVAFYPTRVDCWVDGERVRGQPGGFYGGWVTSDIVGPIKGVEGTEGW